MARHVRDDNVGIVALPTVPVTPANARALYLHYDAVHRWSGVRHALHGERPRELLENYGAHCF